MKMMMPSHVKKIKKYREKVPLFFKENIEEKLNQIYDSEIKLKSGGYLVINPNWSISFNWYKLWKFNKTKKCWEYCFRY